MGGNTASAMEVSTMALKWGIPDRTARAELPSVGVEDMLGFDWQTFSETSAHIPPTQRAAAQINDAINGVGAPDTSSQLNDLSQNIAELKDSIKELRQERRHASSGEHLMLVSDALVALTKSQSPLVDSKPQSSISEKKKARMERNRASAQESRERKRRHTDDLELQIQVLTED